MDLEEPMISYFRDCRDLYYLLVQVKSNRYFCGGLLVVCCCCCLGFFFLTEMSREVGKLHFQVVFFKVFTFSGTVSCKNSSKCLKWVKKQRESKVRD